jgi:hypothetical protein
MNSGAEQCAHVGECMREVAVTAMHMMLPAAGSLHGTVFESHANSMLRSVAAWWARPPLLLRQLC